MCVFFFFLVAFPDESVLKMNEVGHIPLSPASHPRSPLPVHDPGNLGIDMLRDDPRDSLYQREPPHLSFLIPGASFGQVLLGLLSQG